MEQVVEEPTVEASSDTIKMESSSSPEVTSQVKSKPWMKFAAVGGIGFMLLVIAFAFGQSSTFDTNNAKNASSAGLALPESTSVTEAVPPTTVVDASRIAVVDSGFSVSKRLSTPEVSVGAIVQNPSTTKSAARVTATFTLKAADGTVVGTDTATHSYISQGATVPMAASVYLSESDPLPTSLDVGVTVDHFEDVQLADFAFGGLRYSASDYTASIKGTVTSPASKDVKQLNVQCATLAAGKVTGGGFTYVDSVPAKSTVGFELLNGLTPGQRAPEIKCYGAIDSFWQS